MKLLHKIAPFIYTVSLLSGLFLAAINQPVTADAPNLISNSSLETASSSNAGVPAGWAQGSWGTNSPVFSYPSSGHTGSRSVEVQMNSYSSGDAKWYFAPITITGGTNFSYSDYYEASVSTEIVAQYEDANGNYTYADLGTANASGAGWQQFSANFTAPASASNVTIFHLMSSVGTLITDDYSLSAQQVVTSSAPQISMTAPASGSTVSGTVSLSATAAAQNGNAVTGVQFYEDGSPAGSTISNSPYSYSWDSSLLGNGAHVLYAVATAADGEKTTSNSVTVTVNNANLIPNSGVETVNPSNTATPLGWYEGQWGNNSAVFSCPGSGHTGGKSVGITMSNFTDGGADWTYNAQTVTPGKLYEFNVYYQSNVATQALVAVTLSNGTTQWLWLGAPYASDGTWSRFYSSFTMPANAVSAVAYQSISANGYFTADDFDFQQYTPQGFASAMVSVTFDDSIASQVTTGLPVLQKDGIKGTFYVISGYVGVCNPAVSSICYMSASQVQTLSKDGEEVGSHTVDHPDLTTLTTAQDDQELSLAKTTISQWINQPVNDFAAPYGDVNLTVLNEVGTYYVSQRGTNTGYNSKDNYNQMNLLVQNVDSSTTVAQVESYVAYAKATHTWLILVFHDINTNTSADPGYDTLPKDFTTEMSYLKSSGVSTVTISQGIKAATSQL